jgi:hypothetical protein
MAKETLADDILDGVPANAKFLGLTTRQARHLVYSHQLPTFRYGSTGKIRARKGKLRNQPPFGPPEAPVAVRTSRLPCRKAEKVPTSTPDRGSSGDPG